MGTKSTITATPPTAAHQLAGLKLGYNIAVLTAQLAEQVGEVIFLLKEIIKTFPSISLTAAGTISTSSANITMAATIPASVVPGMNVFDVTKNANLGTVSSGAGTSTLVLTANASSAGSGSSDVLQITDANLATYQTLLTSLT